MLTIKFLMQKSVIIGLVTGFLILQPKISDAQEINAANYSSLQAAVKQLPKAGGIVYIPPGTYRISEPIKVTQSNVTLKGAGGSTILLNTSKTGKNTVELEGNHQDSLWHVSIQDIHFKGTPNSGNAIYAHWVEELNFSNLWVDHHGKSGIVLDHCFENPRIHDNNIAYNKEDGIKLLGPHDIVVSANEFEENGIGVYAKNSFNVTLTGNNMDDHTKYSVYFDNTAGSIITGNILEESKEQGIVLKEDKGIVVTGNTLRNAGKIPLHLVGSTEINVTGNTFDHSTGNAIEAEQGSQNITVSGNTFSTGLYGPNSGIYGIVMRGVSNTTIADNTIVHPSEGGIYILGNSNNSLTIEGNTIINPSYHTSRAFSGIYLRNTVNSIISQNIVRDESSEKVMKRAIEEVGNSNFNIISHNRVNKGIQGGIKITGKNTQKNENVIE